MEGGGVVKRGSGMAPLLLETRALGVNYSICDGSVFVPDGLDDDGYLDYYVVVS